MSLSHSGDAIVEMPSAFIDEKKGRGTSIAASGSRTRSSPSLRDKDVSQLAGKRTRELDDDFMEDSEEEEEEDTLGWFGQMYDRILGLNAFIRYALYIVPVGFLLAIPIIILDTLEKHIHVGDVRLVGLFIWLETVWLTLWASNFAASAVPAVFRFFSTFLNRDTQKYSDLLKALEIPGTLMIWSVCAWGSVPIMYHFPYDPTGQAIANNASIPWNEPGSPWTETFKRALLATVPVAAVYLAEKVIVQWVAINYHETQFASKVKEANRWVFLITELYKTSTSLFPNYCKEFEADDDLIHSTLPPSQEAHGASRVVEKLARLGSGLNLHRGGLTGKLTSRQRVVVDSDASVVIAALEKEKTTEALARRIWQSLTQQGAQDLYEEDIARVFGYQRRQEAEALFLKLDFNRNGAVSLDEMTGMLLDVNRTRTAVTRSMSDVKSSIDTFSAILVVAGLVGMAIIYAAFFSSSFLKNLQVITTAVLSLSFAFAGTVQEFAASFIFLFVKHPYDVGDRCEVGDDIEMIVEQISLLHTVFRRVLDNRLVQIPNSVMSTLRVINISRSRNLKQRIHIMVNIHTTGEQLEALQSGLRSFVQSHASRRDYTPDVVVNISAIDDYASLDLVIVYGHKSNFSNESLRLARRNRFMAEILATMRRNSIRPPGGTTAGSGSLEHPQYTIEISREEAQAARDKIHKQFVADRQDDKPSEVKIPSTAQDETSQLSQTMASSAVSTGLSRGRGAADEKSTLAQRLPPTGHEPLRGVRRVDAND